MLGYIAGESIDYPHSVKKNSPGKPGLFHIINYVLISACVLRGRAELLAVHLATEQVQVQAVG